MPLFLFFFCFLYFLPLLPCGRPGTRQWRRGWIGSPSRTPPACPSPRTTGRTSAPSTTITSSASTTSPPRSSPRWTATAGRRRGRPCPPAKSFWSWFPSGWRRTSSGLSHLRCGCHFLDQCCGSVTFSYGSGSADLYYWLSDSDPDPDPACVILVLYCSGDPIYW